MSINALLNVEPEEWHDQAACVHHDPNLWHTEKHNHAAKMDTLEALRICRTECPVKAECLADVLVAERGLSGFSRFGIYGGLTPKARAKYDQDGAV